MPGKRSSTAGREPCSCTGSSRTSTCARAKRHETPDAPRQRRRTASQTRWHCPRRTTSDSQVPPGLGQHDVLRKTTGTHLARDNPSQLGIGAGIRTTLAKHDDKGSTVITDNPFAEPWREVYHSMDEWDGSPGRGKIWGIWAVATTGKLAKLFLAISARNVEEAKRVASEIATEEDSRGHSRAARVLRGALNPNGFKPEVDKGMAVEYPRTSPAVSEGLSLVSDQVALSEVVLRKRWRHELEAIIAEWKNRAELATMGIRHRSRLLFHGPPGCGKSFAARALGYELSLPVYVVRFDSVIGAYLGQTAMHMRELFRFSESAPCVLLTLWARDAVARSMWANSTESSYR